ncbi:MAG: hypothetical protein QN147_04835, partial [Armatimonadota bacterium]|nr:hypothetical protein [Armatimonadota bacterium]
MTRILFVSNGVGEDLIAARIAAELPPGTAVAAYPLVGQGAYPAGVPLLNPRRALPGGGFSLRSGLRGLRADLRDGLVGLWIAQRRTLAAQRGRFDVAVAVGDAYCLWMAARAGAPTALVATADSVHIAPTGALPRRVMRRAARVFARDPETAAHLTAHGLPAAAPGNVMMDLVTMHGASFGLDPDTPVVTLLPGSRREAPANAASLAAAAALVAGTVPEVRFLLAVAPTIRPEAIAARLDGRPPIALTTAFWDAVARAAVVMGMAGTANEQAAGLGRPVVAFPGRGPQFGPQFLAMQARLLGEALVPCRDATEAASAVVRLLRDPQDRARRGAAGRARMGPPGAAARI